MTNQPTFTSLTALQLELAPWQEHNFPDRPAWQPLLGAHEELGELSHSFLKWSQGIRTTEPHQDRMRDAVGDTLVYLADFCNAMGFDMQDCLNRTWDEVRQRDWQRHKASGVAQCSTS